MFKSEEFGRIFWVDDNYDLKVRYFGNNLSFVTSRCYICDLSTFKERDFKFDRKYFKSF